MPNERENILHFKEYDIAGNEIRAYYDASDKLIFVIDSEINETKPNVLLVIDDYDGRKWDDVLANDYDIDLETVRPRKDNKYQKLDIEYSGLELYRDLIDAYDSGSDISASLQILNDFRTIVVRRATAERLNFAETTIENTRDTIVKTNDTLDELAEKLRELRSKLAGFRKNIGKEPTKQSAAKILRTESQIDATNEKVRRAKKRLDNAQKRLVDATDDADDARALLEKLGNTEYELPTTIPVNPVAMVPNNELATVQTPSVPVQTPPQPKAKEMADEEVKPLLDSDPEILDEEIAFKPISFDAPAAALPEPDTTNDIAPLMEPISFTPPVMPEPVAVPEPVVEPESPVLDSITPIDTPISNTPAPESYYEAKPVAPTPVTEPVMPTTESETPVAPVAPMVEPTYRPASPITGIPVATSGGTKSQKQGITYYIMLVALIVLSIFTLWFYQKSTTNQTPQLGIAIEPEISETIPQTEPETQATETTPITEAVSLPAEPEITPEPEFIEPSIIESDMETVVTVQEIEPTTEPIVESEPVATVEEPEPLPDPEPTITEPTVVATPAPILEDSEITPEPTVVDKPAYDVSRDETEIIISENFVTDTDTTMTDEPAESISEPELEVISESPAIVSEPAVINEALANIEYSVPEHIVEETQTVVEQEIPACYDGGEPDKFGCCAGETATELDEGGYACCPDAGGDCFPPLF